VEGESMKKLIIILTVVLGLSQNVFAWEGGSFKPSKKWIPDHANGSAGTWGIRMGAPGMKGHGKQK